MSCPNDAVCQTCPCSGEDDACFPGERLRHDLRRAQETTVRLQNRVLRLTGALHDIRVLCEDQHEDAERLLDQILTIAERELA